LINTRTSSFSCSGQAHQLSSVILMPLILTRPSRSITVVLKPIPPILLHIHRILRTTDLCSECRTSSTQPIVQAVNIPAANHAAIPGTPSFESRASFSSFLLRSHRHALFADRFISSTARNCTCFRMICQIFRFFFNQVMYNIWQRGVG